MSYAAEVNFLDRSAAAKATEWGTWFVLLVPPGLYVRDTLAQAFADEKNRVHRPLLAIVGGERHVPPGDAA